MLFYENSVPRLLRNSGGTSPTFAEVAVNWTAFSPYGSPLFWADMDGDGAPDIVGATSQILWFRNEGAGAFTEVRTGVPAFNQSGIGIVAIGDVDNDGDPDILARIGTSNPALRLYLNDGTGHLVDSQVSLPQGYTRAGGWIDVDGNGLLDLWMVQSATESTSTNSILIFRQDGGRFVETFRLIDPIARAAPLIPAWADFDNDGHVDFVGSYWPPPSLSGPPTNFPALYLNAGNGQFTMRGVPVAANIGLLAPAVADFDDDGSPDLLVRSGTILQPLRNQTRAINALPDAPTSLHATIANSMVVLVWSDSADANQTAALSYNVRIGTAPGKNDVVASMSGTNGTRMIPALVDAGDVDNDGDVDVLARISVTESNVSRPKLVVYRNLGNFGFEQLPGALFDPGAARFADFDQDGRLDVWVAPSATNLFVYRNNGTGFDSVRRVELIAPPSSQSESAAALEVVDLDGDGIAELILGIYNNNSGSLREIIYRRNGDTFQAISSPWGWAADWIQDIADFDQDQFPDLVLNDKGYGSIEVWRGTGALNFSPIASLVSQLGRGASSADFDGDGISDVLTLANDFNRLFLGSTGMVFAPIDVPFTGATAPADFDGDGFMDVAVNMQWQAAVYRGQSRHANHPPTSPSALRGTALATNSSCVVWLWLFYVLSIAQAFWFVVVAVFGAHMRTTWSNKCAIRHPAAQPAGCWKVQTVTPRCSRREP